MSTQIELRANPFPFILSKGDALSVLQILKTIDRLKTKYGFNSLTSVISAQNIDGGFSRDFQKNAPSSVKMTYRAMRALHLVGIDKNSHIMSSALTWLLSQQNTDGGWHENPAIMLPEWMTWESTSKSVTWYTCQIGKLLQQLQMQDTNTFKKIIDFFQSSELPDGGWGAVKGLDGPDPDSSAGIADLLAQVLGQQHQAVSRVKVMFESSMAKLIEKIRSEKVDDAYEITHLIFDDPQNSMYKPEDERVKTLLRALVKAQREDGGWLTFYSSGKSDVPITVYSLQVLVSHRLLDKTVLQNMFDSVSK